MYKYSLSILLIFGLMYTVALPKDLHAQDEPIMISNIHIRNIEYTSVTITWHTNKASNSQINYGERSTEEYKSPANPIYSRDHSVTLANLKPDTRYQFQVTSATPDKETTASQVLTFSTLSFNFNEDPNNVGNFAELNTTPTPTPPSTAPYINPYADSLNPYSPYSYQQPYQNTPYSQPVYLVPPLVYQNNGQALGESDHSTPAPTPTPISTTVPVAGMYFFETGMWGIVALLLVILLLLAFMINQFRKSRNELHVLRDELEQNKIKEAAQQTPENQHTVYSFEVR